ncbi:hypothetical protein CkaCkLH20_06188 [Colletotrichum karsti]|uniref:Uncharacterized protein n=1 Tax=Colletotrichum karsti TaxID=1095194 RepID=A0A9P6I5L6_9PEZI|nr:uncharacterized protein CkaCkLH20_06188 [Colletotrichum karsti]KAF9876245.1 hypothetical protein CkaCkLH20_06188 [Colletotrichum karsti]
MVKQNDVIAIIVIVLFIVLAGVAFGIYRLVHVARQSMSVTSGSSSSSSDEIMMTTYPTAANLNFRPPPPSMDLNILDQLCREVDHLDRTSRTKHLFATWSIDDPSNQGILMLIINELHDRLRARSSALLALEKAQTALNLVMIDLSPETFASHILDVGIIDGEPDMVPEGRAQGARWERQGCEVEGRIARYERESAELRRKISRVAAMVGEPRVLDEAIEIDGCKFTLFGRRRGACREENKRKFEYDGPVAGSVEEVKRGLVETAEWVFSYKRTKGMESGEMKERIQA